MNCYVHEEKTAIGTCVSCGKFICNECATEIQNKYHCKNCVNELFNKKEKELEKIQTQTKDKQSPMVFMNSGGASSSSSSSSAASGGGRRYVPAYPKSSAIIHILLFMFTAGIGNLVYWLFVRTQQKDWMRRYGGR